MNTAPAFVRNSNLYFSPGPMPGTKISHTPCGSSSRIGWTRPSHRLKSPTTLTRSALGAHTAKWTPAIIPQCIGCAPSFS